MACFGQKWPGSFYVKQILSRVTPFFGGGGGGLWGCDFWNENLWMLGMLTGAGKGHQNELLVRTWSLKTTNRPHWMGAIFDCLHVLLLRSQFGHTLVGSCEWQQQQQHQKQYPLKGQLLGLHVSIISKDIQQLFFWLVWSRWILLIAFCACRLFCHCHMY